MTVEDKGGVPNSPQPTAGRRFGYAVAIVVNAIGLYIVQNLLEWDISFVTSDFAQVDGLISLSLIATIGANVLFLFFDPRWFKGAVEAWSQAISLLATLRLLQVFPFDFDEWAGPWEQVARAVLIIAAIGTAIGILTSIRNLVRGLSDLGTSP